MDFFEHQDLARRNSRKLVVLFVLAMIGVILSVYVLLAVAATGYNVSVEKSGRSIDLVSLFSNWPLLLGVGGGTLLFVGGASAFRIAALQGGGQVVASSLGGRPLQPTTADFDERRVLNVVEEMAVASGVPVPPVFLLEEDGINAFAAGYSPQDAVIGVTRGCVRNLNRDELQGVIAHEFSHILNGDMRNSVRLIGFVYGIMAIGYIGWQIMRIAMYSGGGRRDKDSSPIPLIAIGGGLILIGAIGTLFGNWIKASFSRQREYLADASAVQFTRNPNGIAGALIQIGGNSAHADITSPAAPEFSHMYFATGVHSLLSNLFATHPPLEQRIKRILPQWDGSFKRLASRQPATPSASRQSDDRAEARKKDIARTITILAGIEAIGKPTPAHLKLASQLISEIPTPITEAARSTYGARAVIYALLLNHDPPTRQLQLDALSQSAERGLAEMTLAISDELATLSRRHRMPLVEMALGSLKLLSPTQFENFMINLDVLVNADKRTDFFEWVLWRIVRFHLGPPRSHEYIYHDLGQLTGQCSVLISSLAWVGHSETEEVQMAFDAGAAVLDTPGISLAPHNKVHLTALGEALDELDRADLKIKKRLIEASARCIMADRQITDREVELMRAISESLGCPMPPLLPGQQLV